jgi:hypothetical protein
VFSTPPPQQKLRKPTSENFIEDYKPTSATNQLLLSILQGKQIGEASTREFRRERMFPI